MTSLRRDEAIHRASVLREVSYEIALDVRDVVAPDFNSVTTVRFQADPGTATFLEVQPSSVESATVNGDALDLETAFDLAAGRLQLTDLKAQNEVVIAAQMAYSHDGEGLHRHTDPADGKTYLYATSAIAAAPRWFACFDQPDLKAPITLSLECDEQWSAVANGAATKIAPGQWSFATTPKMSTYIATVVAGPYYSVRGTHEGIALGLHVRDSLAVALERDAAELLAFTAACFDEFHRLFGIRYPWGEYHQAFVPDFNWGAMENPGCVTFRDQMVPRGRATTAERASRASTIAHEMAHMWFGNLVTMQWWDDLWLNESFAEYLGHRVTEVASTALGAPFDTWTDFGITRKSWGYTADRRPSTHPIAGNGTEDVDEALNNFDGISYAKGASILRQLATHLGDEVFFSGLRNYFSEHEYANATFADLIDSWTAAGAADLASWAEQWLRTSGLDTLSVERGGSAAVLRRTTPNEPAQRTHTVTVTGFDASGHEVGSLPVRADEDETALPGLSTNATLLLADALDQTWAKVALTQDEWRALPNFVAAPAVGLHG